MLVGICHIELFLPESGSLKDKRSVLSSIKRNIQNRYNVSIAEVGENDKWQRGILGIAMVSNERKFIDQTMTAVIKVIDRDSRAEIIDHLVEIQ
jgi:uncharacterized protein YlxP (DUF503 family)